MATVTHSNNIDHSKEDPSRKRTRATAEQLAVLEDTFSVNVSPNSKLRKQLADQLKMTDRSIQIWFQNRRAKVKHMQKRAQLQMHQASMRAQLYHYQQQHYYLQQHYAPHQRAHSLDSYNMYRSTGVVGASSFVANGPATCPDSIANDFYSSSFETMPSNTMDQQRQSVPPPSLLPYADMIDLNADAWDFSVSPTSANAIDPNNLMVNSLNVGLSISSLAIGRWHRLKMQPKDLACAYHPDRQVLCWNIVDGQHCFKMEMPVTSIRRMTFTGSSSLPAQQSASTASCLYDSPHEPLLTSSPLSPSPSLLSTSSYSPSTSSVMVMGELHLDLYHAPLFYMKRQQEWVSCIDFTEHKQASQVLHHTLKGMAVTLWQELSTLVATHPETRQWVRLNSSSCGSLAGVAEEEPLFTGRDAFGSKQQPLLSSAQAVVHSEPALSLAAAASVVPTLSSLPVTKFEEPFTTPSCTDDFLIDPSLLDPSLWSSTAITTAMNTTASTGSGFIIS